MGINPDFMPFLHLDLAELYFKTEQYSKGKDRSILYLKKYHPKAKLRGKAERILESCKFLSPTSDRTARSVAKR